MIGTSTAFRRAVADGTHQHVRATIDFADGTSREVGGIDVMQGGLSVTRAVSSMSGFDVGGAVTGTCRISLANHDGRFDGCDFTGAQVSPEAGVDVGGSVEWVPLGVYEVEQPDSYGSTVQLSCFDRMRLLAIPYAGAATTYPATLGAIVRGACELAGVPLATPDFPNADYAVAERPGGTGLSCLAVVSYAAQVAGCWARMDSRGRLELSWYDTACWRDESWLDGGTYDTRTVPYSDGDAADGGAFMSGGDAADGGAMGARRWHSIHQVQSLRVCTDDVVVTGVRVRAQDGSGDGQEGEVVLRGSEGYVLSCEDNPLVLYGRASAVAARIGAAVIGMSFRPFSASCLGDPSMEPGDPVTLTDALGRTYRSYVTSCTYVAGGYATVSCDAETPSRNGATMGAAKTAVEQRLERQIRDEAGARSRGIADVARQIADKAGLYHTQAPGSGGTLHYLHDQPTVASSSVVWRMGASAVSVSTDGGRTWNAALTAEGDAVLQRIYAIGINADYINAGSIDAGLITTGCLQSSDGSSYIDLDDNVARLVGDLVSACDNGQLEITGTETHRTIRMVRNDTVRAEIEFWSGSAERAGQIIVGNGRFLELVSDYLFVNGRGTLESGFAAPLEQVGVNTKVLSTSDGSGNSGTGYTGRLRVCYPTGIDSSNSAGGWAWGTLRFVNGILVGKTGDF